MTKKKNIPHYTILTYNIGNYETIKEVKVKSPNARYIYVTDNTEITSNTWEMVFVKNEHPEDPFDLCYKIRFNPFDFTDDDIVIRIDGSMEVIGNTDELIEVFEQGGYDIALCIHPGRNTMIDEYNAWCQYRHYSKKQAKKCLKYMKSEGYDVLNYKGLYQYNFMIQRKNESNLKLNKLTLLTLKYLAEEGKQVERIDQTIGSFIINKYFEPLLKVMPVNQRIAFSKWFSWYAHGGGEKFNFTNNLIEPYLFNKPIKTIDLDYQTKITIKEKDILKNIPTEDLIKELEERGFEFDDSDDNNN